MGKCGKLCEKDGKSTPSCVNKLFAQSFAMDLRRNLHGVLHTISTFCSIYNMLAIDFLLDFFNLVAQSEIEAKVCFDFLNAMHYSGVILNANLSGDFGGTKG